MSSYKGMVDAKQIGADIDKFLENYGIISKECEELQDQIDAAFGEHHEVGYIAHHKDGYSFIKVAEPKKWQLYQKYVWEKAHRTKLSKDQIVIFLDGNKENFDPDNLAMVTRKELMILNHEKMLTADKDLSKTGVLVAKLKMKIKEKENG